MKNKIKSGVGFANRLFYYIFGALIRLAAIILFGFKVRKDKEIKNWQKSKKPFVVLCAHPSDFDAVVLFSACWPRYTRFVAGAQQLYKKVQGGLLRALGAIPKKQFVSDLPAIKSMIRTISNGDVLAMMPEGRVSTDGTPGPIDISTAKLIKKLGVDVAAFVPIGSYFVRPGYNYTGIKLGRVSADFSVLLKAEEISEMSEADILNRICERLSYNASEQQRGSENKYGSKKNYATKNVSNLFYRCPKCKEMYSIEEVGDHIKCSSCGGEARLGRTPFLSGNDFPDNIPDWNKTQLDFEMEFWKNEKAELRFPAVRSVFELGNTADFTGCDKGLLVLNHNGLFYSDDKVSLEVPREKLNGISSDYAMGYVNYYVDNEVWRLKFEDKRHVARLINSIVVLKKMSEA